MSACWGPDCPHSSHKEAISTTSSGKYMIRSDQLHEEQPKPKSDDRKVLKNYLNKIWGNKPKGKAYRIWRNQKVKSFIYEKI